MAAGTHLVWQNSKMRSRMKPVEPTPSTTVVPVEKALDGKESHAEDIAEAEKLGLYLSKQERS
jgi:hypothetical protein